MKVSLPTSALFKEGEVEMRKVQLEILDQSSPALSARPAGVRHDLQFVIGSEFVPGTEFTRRRNAGNGASRGFRP